MLTVLLEGAREGTALKVEKRLDVRFDVTWRVIFSYLIGEVARVTRFG